MDLYIKGKKVDLTNDVSVAFTYSQLDTDTPTTDKNNFSKTVSLKGSPTNNEIFSNAFDLGRNVTEGTFNPRKRVDFKLYDNGELVEQGYIKLDEVVKEVDDITYNITLYGTLGDFFYNLMYNSDGEELTLADLKYGFSDTDEDVKLMLWDTPYIARSWDKLNSWNPDDMEVSNWITAAPTYSGYYSDFDSDKVAVKYNALPDSAKSILDNAIKGISGMTKNGYLLLTGQREMDEWEVGDLRSAYQRPAIKSELIFKALSNPVNNGGYKVEWDDEILNSPYYTQTYIMMDRLDFDNDEQANETNMVRLKDNIWTGVSTSTDFELLDGTSFDFTNATVPILDVNVIEMIALTKAQKKVYAHNDYNYIDRNLGPQSRKRTAIWHYRVEVYDNTGALVTTSSDYFMSTQPMSLQPFVFNDYFTFGEQGIVYQKVNIIPTSEFETTLHQWEKPVKIEMALPREDDVTIVLVKEFVVVDDKGQRWANGLFSKTVGGDAIPFSCNSSVYDDKDDDRQVNGWYDGSRNPHIQPTRVTKKVLFGNSDTPFDYLVGFTKALGLRYLADGKTIKILPRSKYFVNKVNNVDEKIDRSQAITLHPTEVENKWLVYGYKVPETYASKLYLRKNRDDYGRLLVNTGYEFNNETNDLFDDLVYTTAIPYRLRSIYFNDTDMPSVFLTPYVDVTTYKNGDETETKIRCYDDFRHLKDAYDSVPKLCCFSDNNENNSDITNCLVFFDGMSDEEVRMSDSFAEMIELNDRPCYVWTDDASVQGHYHYPKFSKYLTNAEGVYTDSLDYKKPTMTFLGDSSQYQDGITLYDRYWADFISDIYDVNVRSVSVYMEGLKDPRQAMREFFFFDGSLWVIKEIIDFDIDADFTQVTFLKVLSIENYVKGGN